MLDYPGLQDMGLRQIFRVVFEDDMSECQPLVEVGDDGTIFMHQHKKYMTDFQSKGFPSFQVHWSQRCFWWLLTFQRPKNNQHQGVFGHHRFARLSIQFLIAFPMRTRNDSWCSSRALRSKPQVSISKFCQIFFPLWKGDDHRLSRSRCVFFSYQKQKQGLLLLLNCWIGIKKTLHRFWGIQHITMFLLEAEVPPEPGTEQLTAPWIRKQIGGFFDSFWRLQDVELRCKCPSVPSPKMSIFDCTEKTQRSDWGFGLIVEDDFWINFFSMSSVFCLWSLKAWTTWLFVANVE